MHQFVCDMCGKELDHHGERYTVTVGRVPAYRTACKSTWDLCCDCAKELIGQLNRKER